VTNQDHAHLAVSIVVPTFNRRSRLQRLLLALEEHWRTGSRFEVIVVDDGATDGTDRMLDMLHVSYPLRGYRQENQGPAAARNRAINAATGDVLLFLDDDVVPVAGMIERHLAIHHRDPLAIVTGPMIDPPDASLAPWLRWEALMLRKQYDAMMTGVYPPTPRQFYTANASLRRAHVLAAGGFDESFRRAEDVELAYRLAHQGMRFYFEPVAAVLHEPDRGFESWLRVGYEYGRQDVRMARQAGRGYVLDWAFEDFRDRHRLNRALLRWAVGHTARMRGITLLAGAAIRHAAVPVPFRVRRVLCSALFNLHYWQGIADTTGRGAGIWQDVIRHSIPAPRRPWAAQPPA
jgi:GT2 family glycosyltransferase